jgi:alkylation response protein AidB-like acyl-CoA dehydrogenase
MDFRMAEQQAAVLDAVGTLLERHAGATRMRALGADDPAYDLDLDRELRAAGFTGIGREADAGPLEAALVVEAVAGHLGVVAVGAEALVLPGVTDRSVAGPVGLTTAAHGGLVRYAADAASMIVYDPEGEEAVLVRNPAHPRVAARIGYPLARVEAGAPEGDRLGPGSGRRLLDWWRVALAVELVGTMRAALALTVDYVTGREQFGRPIGSFQAVQHRLAETTVLVEGARWLALEAAWLGAPSEAAAAAVVHAADAARRVVAETHQLTGAVGFTTEYGLHLWTMRLPALIVEATWMGQAADDLVALRWGPSAGGTITAGGSS